MKTRTVVSLSVVIGLLVIAIALLIASQSSVAIGNPTVNSLGTKDLAYAPTALSQYIRENQIPTGWLGGVVFQQRWQKSYGWNGDQHNKVRLRVYIPNKLIMVIPCGPRQEKGFAEDYAPGDIVAMAWDGTTRVGQPQDEVRLCKEDMIMMKKAGALNAGATQ